MTRDATDAACDVVIPIQGIYAGAVREAYARGRASAIDKQPVHDAVELGTAGLAGDAQADRTNHGGPERALLQYSLDHYPYWRARFPDQAARFEAPGFGENLAAGGLDETSVHIGDVFRLGECLLQVSQPRSPCWKLNARFGVPDMAEQVQAECRCGWFYRVLETGRIAPGDVLERVERPAASLSVAATMAAVYHDCIESERLELLRTLPALSPNWRDKADRRLARGRTPSAHARLYGAD